MLYHYTKKEYVKSILEKGLIPAYSPSPYYRQPYTPAVPEVCVWLDKNKFDTIDDARLEIDESKLDCSKLKKVGDWYRYFGTIDRQLITE